MVYLALDGGFGQDLRRLLEGGSGEEGLRGKGSLRDTHEDEGIRGQTEVRLARVDACLHDGIGVLELVDIHDGAAQERGVAGILNAHLAHHLTDDDLDVLVVNVNTLLAVHGQNALRQIFLHGLDTGNAQHVMRVERAVGDGLALAHTLSLLDLQADGIRDLIELDLAVVRGDRDVAQRCGGSRRSRRRRRSRQWLPSSSAFWPRRALQHAEGPA